MGAFKKCVGIPHLVNNINKADRRTGRAGRGGWRNGTMTTMGLFFQEGMEGFRNYVHFHVGIRSFCVHRWGGDTNACVVGCFFLFFCLFFLLVRYTYFKIEPAPPIWPAPPNAASAKPPFSCFQAPQKILDKLRTISQKRIVGRLIYEHVVDRLRYIC